MPNADETAMEGFCYHTDGVLDIGDSCDSSANPNTVPPAEKCLSWYCIRDHCSQVCTLDTDCPASMVCGIINFCMDDNCDQISGIGMCLWQEGSGQPCSGNNDCPAGEFCDYWVSTDDVIHKACVTENCDVTQPDCDPVGTEGCGDDGANECWGTLCLVESGGGGNSYCSAMCDLHSDCPSGMICGGLRVSDTLVTGACVTFDGSGDPCTSNADCEGASEVCTYVASPGGEIEAVCMTPLAGGDPGDDCASTSCKNDLCLEGSGDSYCGAVCATNTDCPTGMECSWIGFGEETWVPSCTKTRPGLSPLCSMCDADAECEGDSACIESQAYPGEKYCGLACPVGDECDQIQDAACTDVGAAVNQCKPADDTCDPANAP
jgi:hypothetical protein